MDKLANQAAKNKIVLLYLLETAGFRLMDEQLIVAADDNGLMAYLDLQVALADLVENSLVEKSVSINGTFYAITELGKSMLEFFASDIPYSVRQRIQAYMEANRERFALEGRICTEYVQVGEDQFRVNLRLLENDVPVFALSFLAASKEEAEGKRITR